MAISIDPRSGARFDARQIDVRPLDSRQTGGWQGGAPQRFVPPTERELRSRSVHRLQVGLLGLCAMLLIVGLASIIMTRARLADLQNAPPVAVSSSAPVQKAADPLADIGVVPAADPSAAAAPVKAP